MRRYWIEASQLTESKVHFDGEQFHHIFDVCRQDVGSRFEVLLKGSAHLVEVDQVGKKNASANILETRKIPALPSPQLHIVLSLARYQVMDSVVEKLVELGVSSLHPVYSEFSFVRNPSSFPNQKYERWQKIIVSATQQTGRGELMTLAPPQDLLALARKINQTESHMGLFAYEGEATQNVKGFLGSRKNSSITDIWCFVGSEGGFSAAEVQELKKLGFDPVTLGTQVLRVETACMTLVSILKYEFDLMR